MQLRPYQSKLKADVYAAWQSGASNVAAVLPTGGGKTILFSDIVREHVGHSVEIAHRQELVSQISLANARYGLTHNIIGPKNVVKWVVQLHMRELGRSFYDPGAHRAVAGVDTLLSRKKDLEGFCNQVSLWVLDEAHHLLKDNKWGKAAALFPNARGLGVTANTERADGKGLGKHADGLLDVLVEGPGMRDLINDGYLTDYRIFAPPSDLNLEGVEIGSTGDYKPNQLKLRIKKSHVVGDVVQHYLRLAKGKQGITFATDVETATEIAAKFNAAGVVAEVVSAKTPDNIRTEIGKRFERREVQQLVNVDLFGEGYDVPAIEVVSMARPTESFNLFCQQFGRSLRILEGKTGAIIIDHVGNVLRHGLPDAYQEWTLDRREKGKRRKKDADVIPVKSCGKCTSVYEAIYKACPFCGHVAIPALRSAPEFVDGDLTELDPSTLAKMRGEVDRINLSAEHIRTRLERGGMPGIAAGGAAKQHRLRQEAQVPLREAIAWWAGHQRNLGHPDSESYKRFWFMFGTDVMTAQTLGRTDAALLAARINKTIGRSV